MNQNELRKQLKLAKIENDWIKYGDVAQMLSMNVASLYNWLNAQYKISQTKAKILKDWLSDLD